LSKKRKTTVIRAATPEDAEFLARIILIAGRAHVRRGIWEVVLGGTEEDCLRFLKLLVATDPPHLFHYSSFIIAEVGRRPAAALGGYDPTKKGYNALTLAVREVQRAMRSVETHAPPETGAQKVLDCVPDTVEGAWVIDSVAALPRYRRQGIVSRLLEEILEKGRRGGFKKAQVNIYIGNIPAQKAYEKFGFKIHEGKHSASFEEEIGSPGMASLVVDL